MFYTQIQIAIPLRCKCKCFFVDIVIGSITHDLKMTKCLNGQVLKPIFDLFVNLPILHFLISRKRFTFLL